MASAFVASSPSPPGGGGGAGGALLSLEPPPTPFSPPAVVPPGHRPFPDQPQEGDGGHAQRHHPRNLLDQLDGRHVLLRGFVDGGPNGPDRTHHGSNRRRRRRGGGGGVHLPRSPNGVVVVELPADATAAAAAAGGRSAENKTGLVVVRVAQDVVPRPEGVVRSSPVEVDVVVVVVVLAVVDRVLVGDAGVDDAADHPPSRRGPIATPEEEGGARRRRQRGDYGGGRREDGDDGEGHRRGGTASAVDVIFAVRRLGPHFYILRIGSLPIVLRGM